jgi:hypothetical protein
LALHLLPRNRFLQNLMLATVTHLPNPTSARGLTILYSVALIMSCCFSNFVITLPWIESPPEYRDPRRAISWLQLLRFDHQCYISIYCRMAGELATGCVPSVCHTISHLLHLFNGRTDVWTSTFGGGQ